MKEYRVEMLVKGSWVPSRGPNTGKSDKPFNNIDSARRAMITRKYTWDDRFGRCKKYYPDTDFSTFPTAFRIVSRDVTEWAPVEEA